MAQVFHEEVSQNCPRDFGGSSEALDPSDDSKISVWVPCTFEGLTISLIWYIFKSFLQISLHILSGVPITTDPRPTL